MTNYRREMRMGGDIRKSRKVENVTEFVERIKRVQEEARAALKKAQECNNLKLELRLQLRQRF